MGQASLKLPVRVKCRLPLNKVNSVKAQRACMVSWQGSRQVLRAKDSDN